MSAEADAREPHSIAGTTAHTSSESSPADKRLGVCICTLNEERALPRLLSRALQIREPRDRADLAVVADGGSSDATAEIAYRYGATVLEPGVGRGVQLRAGAAELMDQGSDVLLFLHADSLPRTGSIEALRRAFEAGVHAAAMRQTVVAEGRRYRWIERAANARARRGMVYGDSGLAVTTEAYRASGGFPDWPLFEDVALSKRLRKSGKIHLVEDSTLAISARRWEREGVVRGTTRNVILRGLFECGVSPRILARAYRPHRRRSATEH